MLWVLCRLNDHAHQTVSGWTGFNILCSKDKDVSENTLGYLPPINSPATDMASINEILNRSLQIRGQLQLESIVCVFDQAIYAKACEIKLKHRDKFQSIVLRMGTFHTICTLISIIGKRFKDAGLKDLLVETSVIAEGSVSAVLEGRMYNRGVRAHKLLYEALLRIAWKRFIPWVRTNYPNQFYSIQHALELIADTCEEIGPRTSNDTLHSDTYHTAVDLFDKFLNVLRNESGPLSCLWMSYMDLTETMLQMIRASREQNWSLHLSSVRDMIPWQAKLD